MFTGIRKTSENERTITILENAVVEKNISRYILFGKDENNLTKLSQHFLTALNAQGFRTKYLHVNDISGSGMELSVSQLNRQNDIVVLDGIGGILDLTDEQKEEIHDFLSIFQHDRLFLTCTLTPDEVFSDQIRNIFDTGITWSRNFLGCRQLFMNDNERQRYIKLLNYEQSGDYRIIQSLEFLESNIIPYYELSFLTKDKIKKLLENGNDSNHNCLVITKEPKLQLINFRNLSDAKIAVRLETFMAGNGYVGSEVSDREVSDYYRFLLEGYYSHLNNDEEIFMDTSIDLTMSDNELVRIIKEKIK